MAGAVVNVESRWLMKQTELQYTAGLFDGRGTITLWKPSTFKWKLPLVRLTVTKKRYALLDFLQDTYGGTVSNAEKDGKRRYWCITAESALLFLQAIRPHVKVPLRQQQIDYILTIPRFKNSFRPTRTEVVTRAVFEAEWKIRFKKGKK